MLTASASKIFVSTLLCVLGFFDAEGQMLPFVYYTPREGLISNGVNSLCQDSRGYLWIGTSEGLSVFDGDRFTNYRTNEGLALNYVTAITESRVSPGTMWIGTLGGGISRFSNGRFTTIHLDSLVPANQIVELVEDRSGALWCGTAWGLYIFEGNQPRRLQFHQPYERIGGMTKIADGRVCIGVDQSLMMMDSPTSVLFSVQLSQYCKGRPESFLADADTTFWVGTSDGYILHFRDSVLLQRRSTQFTDLNSITDDGVGNLWICSQQGLLEMEKRKISYAQFVCYTTENGIPDNHVVACMFDRENNLWIGGFGQGLSKLADRSIMSFRLSPPPVGSSYHPAAAEDMHKHFWAISADGLWEFWKDRENHWTGHVHPPGELPSSTQISSVQFDRESNIVLGYSEGSIFSMKLQYRDGFASRLTGAQRVVPGAKPAAFFIVDRRGNFWLSDPSSGVEVVDRRGTMIRNYSISNALPSNDIRDMFQDSDGNVWLGGVEGGIVIIPGEGLDTNHTRRLTLSDGLTDERIRTITQDSKGRMWIGTRHGGIVRYDHGTFRSVSIREGLISNTVWWMRADGAGRMWCGTQLGLQALDENVLQPQPVIKALIGDGVICCGISADSVLWSYQPNFFKVYELGAKQAKAVPPLVNITRFQVNGEDRDLTHDHLLHYDQHFCTFDYIGIYFKDEKSVRYQYRLIGAESEWQGPTDHHAVTFATLNPGSYTFEVRAISGDEILSTTTASLAFTIVPPYWQRWWFQLFIGVCLLGILILVYRYRVARRLELERTRTRIARDLHDEVGGTLSSISYFADALRADASDQGIKVPQHFLSLIMESAASAKAAMSDIAWSLDPSNDSWEKLLSKMRRYAVDILEAKSIRHVIQIAPPPPHAVLRMEPRQNLWLLYKELIVNAVKHSNCSVIKIAITMSDSTLQLRVEDNGIGFDPTTLSEGRGINNIRERVKMLKGSVNLHTSPGSGTRWEILCPL